MRAELHGDEGAAGAPTSKRRADEDEEMEDMETPGPSKPASRRRKA